MLLLGRNTDCHDPNGMKGHGFDSRYMVIIKVHSHSYDLSLLHYHYIALMIVKVRSTILYNILLIMPSYEVQRCTFEPGSSY